MFLHKLFYKRALFDNKSRGNFSERTWGSSLPLSPHTSAGTGRSTPVEGTLVSDLNEQRSTLSDLLWYEPRGGWTWSHDMKSKWSRATNSRYLMYSSSSSPFICPIELDQWYHSKELALTISERPSTRSNPYVPEELWPLENCGGCGRMARNSQNAPNCRRHNSIHHLYIAGMSYSQAVNLLHRLPTYKSISAVKINLRSRECRKPRECQVNYDACPASSGVSQRSATLTEMCGVSVTDDV